MIKRIISVLVACLVIFLETGCGDSGSFNPNAGMKEEASRITDETSTNTQDTTKHESTTTTKATSANETTETTTHIDITPDKYIKTITKDCLGKTEDFLQVFQEKLHDILGIDDLHLVEDKGNKKIYQYDSSNSDFSRLELWIGELEDKPGYISYVDVYALGPNLFSMFSSSAEIKKKNNHHLCEIFMPLAIFQNYTTEEQILAAHSKFYLRDSYDPTDSYGTMREYIVLPNYYVSADYNQKTAWVMFGTREFYDEYPIK